ncbi:MAG TPA: hypothetical protein VK426_08955, partial [Methanobacterium sp.]|nr:hypothetical protein [Methanobacterium sp.]
MENIKKERNQKAEYIVAIIFNLIFLYIVNNLLNWNIYFITSALNDVLWIINLSIITAIIGNALLLAYNPEWFRHVIKIIMNILALISTYFVYTVFPFNFYNSFINWGLSIFLILIMAGIGIAIILEFYFLLS